jgi:hypothetical protein
MQQRCVTCGKSAGDGETIETFTELGFGPHEDGGHLHLCRDCLGQRRATDWPPDIQVTKRVLSVLENAAKRHPQGRYSYLRDTEEGVHLVRLDNEWTRRHAEH